MNSNLNSSDHAGVQRYHRSVRSGLRAIALVARASPYVVLIQAPLDRAIEIARRQVERYPSIGVDHSTRTALRKVGQPAVQMVIMPPDGDKVSLVLLSNVIPNEREQWQLALDPDWPLVWRHYQLASGRGEAITWRLNEQIRAHYRCRINRLITGRGGQPRPGEKLYQLPAAAAREQLLKLADHLTHYPGFSGIRQDVFELAQHSSKVWRSTHPQEPAPLWPRMPYLRFRTPETADLANLPKGDLHEIETEN